MNNRRTWVWGGALAFVVLSSIAPRLASELWEKGGYEGDVTARVWPTPSEELLQAAIPPLPVRIDGRCVARMKFEAGVDSEKLASRAQEIEEVREHLRGHEVQAVYAVPGKVVNIVLRTEAPAEAVEAPPA